MWSFLMQPSKLNDEIRPAVLAQNYSKMDNLNYTDMFQRNDDTLTTKW